MMGHMISFICGILKKNDTNKLIDKTETNSQAQKINLCLPKENVEGMDKLGV